ncbi:hypothetical protein CP981_26100 [Streptomyces platensis]|uniref:Uncharacterized protein n=1 Tax=Streptomyces platensis TaxID=58346 RepID=A0AAE6NKU5_STRPT|nr:hypothetical protein CP981_26100 [Streptomyces platensis]
MKRQTAMQGPVYVMVPESPPEPAEGCDVCDALVRQRREAQARGDRSAVSDCNVELAAHTKQRKPRRRE